MKNVIQKLYQITQNHFKAIKVILIIRRQSDLVQSIFAENYVNYNSILGIDSADEFANYLLCEGNNQEADSLLQYNYLIETLDEVFGRENVLVLPYEKMKENVNEFLVEIASFMEIEKFSGTKELNNKKDNIRSISGNKGRIAKTREYPKSLQLVKRKLFGEKKLFSGDRPVLFYLLKKRKFVQLSSKYHKRMMNKYREKNIKLAGRVKWIKNFDYFESKPEEIN